MKNDYCAFMFGAVAFVLTALVYGLASLGYDTSYPGTHYWGVTPGLSYTIGEASGTPDFLKYLWSGTIVAFFIVLRIILALLVGLIVGAIVYGITYLFSGSSEGSAKAIPPVPPAPNTPNPAPTAS